MDFRNNFRTLRGLDQLGETSPDESVLEKMDEELSTVQYLSAYWTPDHLSDAELVRMLEVTRVFCAQAKAARATSLYLHVSHGMEIPEYMRKDHQKGRRTEKMLVGTIRERLKEREKTARLFRSALKGV